MQFLFILICPCEAVEQTQLLLLRNEDTQAKRSYKSLRDLTKLTQTHSWMEARELDSKFTTELISK